MRLQVKPGGFHNQTMQLKELFPKENRRIPKPYAMFIRLTLIVAALSFAFFYGCRIVDYMQVNWAWVLTAKSFLNEEKGAQQLQRATAIFDRLKETEDRLGIEAAWGARLTRAELNGDIPQTPEPNMTTMPAFGVNKLLAVSDWYMAQNDVERGLTPLRVITNLLPQNQDALNRISAICRQQLPSVEKLGPAFQESCLNVWQSQAGNIITNGNFGSGSLAYWERHYTPGSTYTISVGEEEGEQAAHIKTETLQYHGGLFQELQLPLGTTGTLSARIKIVGNGAEPDQLRVLPLYIAYTRSGERRVSAGAPLTGPSDWQTYSRSFTIDNVDNPDILFYPVYIYGQGDVWIDDVAVYIDMPAITQPTDEPDSK
ncbi:MAG: carbohydrate binding domain-containing protein [Caldilineaceae bacterium]|nr:carbohydrate binding domain-containing protein [Caldilineaceae bacterium]